MLQFATEVKEQTPRFVSPLHFPQTVGNYAAGALARTLKLNGPNVTLGGGSHAGLAAIAEAVRLLTNGRAELILAGGTDAVSPALLTAMIDAGQADPNGPFASQPAEGACFCCLETESCARQRGAAILARISIADDPPATEMIAGEFTGHADRDSQEVDAMRKLARPAGDGCFLSPRHLVANAFAATAAAQLAVAAIALTDRKAARWQLENTDAVAPLVDLSPVHEEISAALVVSARDQNDRRTILRIERTDT
jgi:3-oxoacyl-(acyl-carrier-protein) synthase